MASSSGIGTLVKVGAVGAAAYFAYEWWQGQQTAAAAPASGTAAAGTPPAGAPATGATSTAAPASPAAPSSPSYSGPSLAQMYQALLAAVVMGMQGGDTAVTCPGSGVSGWRGLGIGSGSRTAGTTDVATVARNHAVGIPTGTGSQVPASRVLPVTPASASASCSLPYATPDVFNWYLTQRANVGISVAPSSANMGIPDTATDINTYWSAVSPLLQQQVPGLSGWGRRRGFGDDSGNTSLDLGSVLSGAMSGPASGGSLDLSQVLASASGQPVATVRSEIGAANPSPGVSVGAIALAAGAGLLLVGMARGRR